MADDHHSLLDRLMASYQTAAKEMLSAADQADEDGRLHDLNIRRYLAAMFGITAPPDQPIAMTYEVIRRAATDPDATFDDIPLPADACATLASLAHAQVDRYTKDAEKPFAYWDQLTAYMRQNPTLTQSDVLLFLQYTQQMLPPPDGVVWRDMQQKQKAVDMLASYAIPWVPGALANALQQVVAGVGTGDSFDPHAPIGAAANCAVLALGKTASPPAPSDDSDVQAGPAAATQNNQ